MPLREDQLPRCIERIQDLWRDSSRWGAPAHREAASVSMGNKPIRPAIRNPDACFEPRFTESKERVREVLQAEIRAWPSRNPRLAIEGDTGLGKTYAAVERCVAHVADGEPIRGSIVFVAHSKRRVGEVLGLIRQGVREQGNDPRLVVDLLGRQELDPDLHEDWSTRRFGCEHFERVETAGKRGRDVVREVCTPCTAREACGRRGYIAHTDAALEGSVIVTTVQRFVTMPKRLWGKVGAVICDEDIMPGLLEGFHVLPSDIRRAVRWLETRVERGRLHGTSRSATQAGAAVLPLFRAVLDLLEREGSRPSEPLLSALPDSCDRYFTEEGMALLRAAMSVAGGAGQSDATSTASERRPAPWEAASPEYTPRQVFGRLITALLGDIEAGSSVRAAVVRVVATSRRRQPRRLHVFQMNLIAVQRLREVPVLLLDATLHPAIDPILDVERRVLRYDQGRKIIQVLCGLNDLKTLRLCADGPLSRRGQIVVSQLAAFVRGRHGYVLCRKPLVDLLRAESRRYYELRRVEFVTPKRERGWDADPRANVFVVLGRYARSEESCEREAHALRSAYLQLCGSTAGLDAIALPPRPAVYPGRGEPVFYRGEITERDGREPADRLAALIQSADRISSVRQFLGRDRSGTSHVLLLRGDPTIGADALIEEKDLATALPVDETGSADPTKAGGCVASDAELRELLPSACSRAHAPVAASAGPVK